MRDNLFYLLYCKEQKDNKMLANPMNLFIFIGSCIAGGLLMAQTKLPGGIIMGALVAGIIAKFLIKADISLPNNWQILLQIFIGLSIASKFEVEMLHVLKPLLWPVLLSALALSVTGVLTTLILVKTGLLDLGTAYFATSPGAMSVLAGIAASMDVNAPATIVFHLVRIVIIAVTAPFVLKLLRYLVH